MLPYVKDWVQEWRKVVCAETGNSVLLVYCTATV